MVISACGSSSDKDSDSGPRVVSVSISTDFSSLKKGIAGITIFPGDTIQFSATAHYDNDSSEDISASADWLSADIDVLTVDPTGLVTAIISANDPVSLTASYQGVASTDTNINVIDVSLVSIKVTPKIETAVIGEQITYKARGYYTGGISDDITSQVSWRSQNSNIASISTDGIASAEMIGSARLFASFEKLESNVANLVVEEAEVAAISIKTEHSKLPIGIASQYRAFIHFTNNTKREITEQVTWRITNPEVATVDIDGLVTALQEGNAFIHAEYLNQYKANSVVNVTDAELLSIALSPGTQTIPKGLTLAYTVTALYSVDGSSDEESGKEYDVTNQAFWRTSHPEFVAINSGIASAKDVGNTLITATFKGLHMSSNLYVSEAQLVSITISPEQPSIVKGRIIDLKAWGFYTDTAAGSSGANLTDRVTWSVTGDNAKYLADNDQSGRFLGMELGEALITASFTELNHAPEITAETLTIKAPLLGSCDILEINGERFSCPLTKEEADAGGIEYYATGETEKDGNQYVRMTWRQAMSYCYAQGATLPNDEQFRDLHDQVFKDLAEDAKMIWPIDSSRYWDVYQSITTTYLYDLKTGFRTPIYNQPTRNAYVACALSN